MGEASFRDSGGDVGDALLGSTDRDDVPWAPDSFDSTAISNSLGGAASSNTSDSPELRESSVFPIFLVTESSTP